LLTDLRLQRDLSEPLRLAVPLAAQDELSNIRRLCNGIWERLLLQHQRLLDTIARLQYASTHLEQLARQRTQTLERVATNLQRNEGWLHAFAAIASGSAPVMTRIEELLALACRCAEMDIGFVTLNRGKALKVMAVYPAVASVPSEAELPYAAILYDQVHQQQTLVTYLRLSASPWAASAPNSHEGAYLGLPLLLPRQVMVGAFHLYRASERPNALDPDELSLIRLCAAAIGSALLRDWHEQMLYQAKERAQVTLASIGDAVFVTNAHGQVEYLNPAAEQLSDWDSARARHTDIQALLPLVDAAGDSLVTHPVQLCFQSRKVIRIQDCFLPSGTTKAPLLAVEGTVAAIRNRHGVTEGAVVVIADVSAERALLQQLHFQSQHDPLTGLVNRHEFERRLGVVMESPEVGQHVLCYLDLDQFKLVNDTCGHAVGDELLRQVAHLLQKQLEPGDTLARLGGDEFGALLLHCTPDESLNRSRRLRDAISNFRFGWQGRVFSVGVSIGLVRLGDVHKNLALALSAADSACYAAKEQGRNRVHTFQPDDLDMARRQGEMQWVLRIKQALEEDRFILYHQPIIALAHDRLPRQRHSEILLRMRDEEGRIIPPGAFLGAAERYDLMPQIDRWVIERVFSQFQAWLKDGSLRLHRCSINLSGASMGEADLGYFIRHRLKAYHLPPELFCFEITETSAISNLQQARKLIDSLKQLGCAFSLDDFGSGLSSFGYLKNLPVDYLKIDGAFIRDMENDPIDYAMVRSINEVGHLMHLKTVAEFVQTQQVLEMLREIHVDYAQGYWLAKPVPLTLMTQI
jgi:diguanylate cyclase (GGDEF)-like protein